MSTKSVFYVTKKFSDNAKHVLSLQPFYAIVLMFNDKTVGQFVNHQLFKNYLKRSFPHN